MGVSHPPLVDSHPPLPPAIVPDPGLGTLTPLRDEPVLLGRRPRSPSLRVCLVDDKVVVVVDGVGTFLRGRHTWAFYFTQSLKV